LLRLTRLSSTSCQFHKPKDHMSQSWHCS
jgi:hypothetical protein